MNKKVVIGGIVGVLILAIIAVLIFVVDIFGWFNSKAYDYNFSEYVKVANYKNLEYDKVSVSVSDKEVKDEISSRCEKAATTESVTTGTVKDGDTINVAYEGKIDGKTFENGSTDSTDITIGTTNYIDGFTDGLIGKKVGSTVTLNLKFPDDYSDTSVAGKDVVFEVTINSKNKTVIPEYNLDFVKENSDYDNLADYEASIKKELLKSKKSDAETDIKNDLWQGIVDDSKVLKYPEERVKEETEAAKEEYKTMATNYGVSWEDFLSQYVKMSEKEFNKYLKKSAKEVVKNKLVLYAIAEKEGIELSKSEYNDYLDDLMKSSGYTEESFKTAFGMSLEEYAEKNNFEFNYLLDLVTERIMKLGTEK